MTSTRMRAALALCAGLMLGLGARAEGNLLVNGSFEQPGGCALNCVLAGGSPFIAGWTTFLSGVEYVAPLAFGAGNPPDGQMAVDLANHVYPQGGGIEQSFDTVVGKSYLLRFWTGNAAFDSRSGNGTVRVQVADVDLSFDTPQAAALQGVWQLQTLVFAATSARTALRFSNTQDPLLHYALIDAVSVSTVPELPSGQLVLFGLALLLLARSRGLHA